MFWAVWHVDALTKYYKPPQKRTFLYKFFQRIGDYSFLHCPGNVPCLKQRHILNRRSLTIFSEFDACVENRISQALWVVASRVIQVIFVPVGISSWLLFSFDSRAAGSLKCNFFKRYFFHHQLLVLSVENQSEFKTLLPFFGWGAGWGAVFGVHLFAGASWRVSP